MSLVGLLQDTAAQATAEAAHLLSNGPVMVVDFFPYKPPEELKVRLEDVYMNWKRDVEAGSSIFKREGINNGSVRREDASKGSDSHEHEAVGNGSGQNEDSPAAPPDYTPATAPPHPSEEGLPPPRPRARTAGELLRRPSLQNLKDDGVKDILVFQLKIFQKAGLSEDGTYLPRSIHPKLCGNKPKTDLDSSMAECKMAVTGAVEGLLKKLDMSAKEVDILVTVCSVFCPTPSLASMLVNHFKMRNDVVTYHLGGMGCANGVIAINLIRDLLKAHPNSNALLVCNETVTPALYQGKDKHRLVANVLFRMGASAILLSNNWKWRLKGQAKYALQSAIRVHAGARDDAYGAIHVGPDDEGLNGIYLGLNVVKEATSALTIAMHKSGRYLLTTRQLLEAAWYYVLKYLGRPLPGPFSPCFAEGVQHFCIHAGGRKVLDGIGSSLKLDENHLEPSRAVLWDYGNVSSSTTWYTLAFIESLRGLRRGDKVLQIGVGSGLKCGVNVWKALRDVDDVHLAWDHRVSEERRSQLQRRRLHLETVLSSLLLLLLSILVVVVAFLYQS